LTGNRDCAPKASLGLRGIVRTHSHQDFAPGKKSPVGDIACNSLQSSGVSGEWICGSLHRPSTCCPGNQGGHRPCVGPNSRRISSLFS
jgi:hypothetical protein